MSLNTWIPESQLSSTQLDAHNINLQEYILIGANENIAQLIENLSVEKINTLTPLMKQPVEFWHIAAEKLEASEIMQLMRFFTLAEEKNSLLFSGKQSPVIALNKLLKARNMILPKEELLWIKAHSSNRFLPNGSVL